MDWTWLLVVYLIVVLILIIMHRQMRRNHKTLVRTLVNHMDELVAHYTSTLWMQRDHIYQYQENVGLLFRTMEDMIHDPHASYQQYMERRYEDMTYAQSLVPDAISIPDMDTVHEMDETLDRVGSLYRGLGVIIIIMTGGLYRLWKQPLYHT